MGKRILVVDDDRTVVKMVQGLLEPLGYEVVEANDGDEGLVKLKDAQPSLIILDVQMPKMNGYTFIFEMKKMGIARNVPIIVLTAKEGMADIFKVEGVKEYMVKPFNSEDFLVKVKKHVAA